MLPFVRSKKDGRRLSYCRKCRYKQVSDHYYSSPERFFIQKEYKIVQTLKSNRRKSRNSIPYSLPPGYLLKLWVAQQGKCFYTEEELSLTRSKELRKSLSIDRVDNSKGYVVGNVVICSYRANGIKGNLTMDEFAEYLPVWAKKVREELPKLLEQISYDE